MSKLVNAPVRVITNVNGTPVRFLWKHRWFEIESIEEVWPLTGQWWNGEPQKMFWRVKAGTRLFEICEIRTCPVSKRPQASDRAATGDEQVEKCGNEWQLYKIY